MIILEWSYLVLSRVSMVSIDLLRDSISEKFCSQEVKRNRTVSRLFGYSGGMFCGNVFVSDSVL